MRAIPANFGAMPVYPSTAEAMAKIRNVNAQADMEITFFLSVILGYAVVVVVVVVTSCVMTFSFSVELQPAATRNVRASNTMTKTILFIAIASFPLPEYYFHIPCQFSRLISI